MNERLYAMIDELDPMHEVQLGSIVNNLLKTQRVEQRIAKKKDTAIEKARKIDPVFAEHINGNESQCSFCGKWSNDVDRMIAGPHGLYICSECVSLCVQILEDVEKEDE